MPRLEFVAQSSRDVKNPQATGERLINLYAEPMPAGAQAQYALKAVPGTVAHAQLPGVFVRAMANAPGYDGAAPFDRLFAVSGGRLSLITEGGEISDMGAVPDSPETSIGTNNGKITIAADGRYFVHDGQELTEPDTGAFNAIGDVEYLGNYTVMTERGGRRFQWTEIADPTDLPGLYFATAEARDDTLLRVLAIDGNLWLFGSTSIEIWSLTGLGNEEAFSRVGPVIETGLAGFGLICKLPGGAMFVGNDGVVYLTGGTAELQPVSSPAVNEAIEAEQPSGCFFYEFAGHKFAVLRFAHRPAWVFDLATAQWHERADGADGSWGATAAARVRGQWFAAGWAGAVRRLARVNADNGAELVRTARSRPMVMDGKRLVIRKATVLGDMGRSDLGRPATVRMRVSRDGGRTWAPWRSASLGDLGQYAARAVFRNLGLARVLVAELRVTDPADLVLWSAAEVET